MGLKNLTAFYLSKQVCCLGCPFQLLRFKGLIVVAAARLVVDETFCVMSQIKSWERDDLLGWVCQQVAKAEFTIFIDKSSLKKPTLTMQCERNGEYKPPKTRKKSKRTGSRKCQCPFRLRGFFEKDTNGWWIAMLSGIHHHELEEKKRVIDMTKSLAVLRNILTDLKEKNKESLTTIKQVYNTQTRWHKGIIGDKTKIQYLISKLEGHKYVYFARANSEETTLEDIYISHPESINMLNTFPTVLIMEASHHKYSSFILGIQ
ncbi:transcription factor AFT [Medicago truncatula]|uniref:Transcription factor AFT n=1 Tax=Medicago truncatula TaxID=3880 RepID=G7JWX6_MEDTR|nr:transcription factor AFT [Medicago truncatula]